MKNKKILYKLQRKCIICENKFVINSSRQKTCSIECRIIKNKLKNKTWWKNYYIKNRKKVKCGNCKRLFISSFNKKYCCDDCAKQIRIKWFVKYNKKYKQTNKKRIQLQRKKYTQKRLKVDIQFKILGNLRSRINMALKTNCKSASTIKLLGCSIDFLKKRLEKQFKSGITWNNYGRGKGKWNIDHIKPCYKFDLRKLSEQRRCFNYKNLRPLWFIENINRTNRKR